MSWLFSGLSKRVSPKSQKLQEAGDSKGATLVYDRKTGLLTDSKRSPKLSSHHDAPPVLETSSDTIHADDAADSSARSGSGSGSKRGHLINTPAEMFAIRNRLYIGNASAACDRALLHRHGITHVVNTLGVEFQAFENMIYLTINVSDVSHERVDAHFEKVTHFIHDALSSSPNNAVLVHCTRGKSRSATLLAAYLMDSESKTAHEAVSALRERAGSAISPNPGFMTQLQQHESALLRSSRSDLHAMGLSTSYSSGGLAGSMPRSYPSSPALGSGGGGGVPHALVITGRGRSEPSGRGSASAGIAFALSSDDTDEGMKRVESGFALQTPRVFGSPTSSALSRSAGRDNSVTSPGHPLVL